MVALQIISKVARSGCHFVLEMEFFTVLLVFRPESGGIWSIPGIILAVVPAKIVISVLWNPSGFRNGHRNHWNGIASGIDRNGIHRIFFNSNSN